MPMTKEQRMIRLERHQAQRRIQVKPGIPNASDLNDGVPVLRTTREGVVEYVRYNGILYKKVLDKA
jgi:hypothetical protein